MKIYSILILLISFTINAQQKIYGVVIDQQKKVIPYVNIGIPNTGNGTCSDITGTFKITINDDNITDSLFFSSIGFQMFKILPIEIIENDLHTIILQPDTLKLEAIVIEKANLSTSKVIGNQKSKFSSYGFIAGEGGGAQISRKVVLKKVPVRISEISFYANNQSTTTKQMRVNILEYLGNDFVNIANATEMVNVEPGVGWVSVKYNHSNVISKANQILLAIEWVDDDFSTPMIGVSGKSRDAYYKRASFDQWSQIVNMNWGIKAKIFY